MHLRCVVALALFTVSCASAPRPKRFDVRLVTDEADALLNILDKRASKQPIADSDWTRLFTSEGFVRLKKRESSMHRPFDEDVIRKFVMSDELLAKRDALARTLADWKRADLTHASQLALAYLPPNATIRAKVYPVIKPQSNSFVFEVETDPAIFKYVEDQPREAFEATMSHEMHHVGYGTACPSKEVEAQIDKLPPNVHDMVQWIGAFGEGFAVLAAAGGPDKPAQAHAERADLQSVFDAELAKYDENFHAVESFLLDVGEGRLTGDAVSKRAFDFFGLLGPWYTVGWKMDVVIETTLGRGALIDAMCDQRKLFATYNRAADAYEQRTGGKLPRWSPRLIEIIGSH